MNSDVDVDGTFNFRHRVVGALVLVILGIVILPIILNGASMTQQVVEIDKSHGEKQPRTFETNIRPLGNDESSVKVDSESDDQLKANLSFSKPEAPDIEAENAPQSNDAEIAPAAAVNLSNSDANKNAGTSAPDIQSKAQPVAQAENGGDNAGDTVSPSGDDSESERVAKVDPGSSEIIPLPEVDPTRAAQALNKDGDASESTVPKNAEPVDLNAKTEPETEKRDSDKPEGRTDEKLDTESGKESLKVEAEKVEGEKAKGEQAQNTQVTGVAGWVVRVGTFGEADNAARMVDLLSSKGFAGQSSISKTKSGKTLTRVWVGPFETRADASQKLSKIEQTTGEKGFITAYP